MTQTMTPLSYQTPISNEQIPQLPYEFSPLSIPPYPRMIVDQKLSLIDQLEQITPVLYQQTRNAITHGNPDELLTPSQLAKKDQLDAEYRGVIEYYDDLRNHRNKNSDVPIPDLSSVSLTAEEASDMVDSVTVTFGLSTTDIASILCVTRQTIYAWSRGGNPPNPTNCQRLRQIDRLAQHWRTLSEHSAKLALKIEFDNGKSILSELQKEAITETEIQRVMEIAVEYIDEKKAKVAQRIARGSRPEVSEADIMSLEAFIPKLPNKK